MATRAEKIYNKEREIKNKIDALIKEVKADVEEYIKRRNEAAKYQERKGYDAAILICNSYLDLLEKMRAGEEIKNFGAAERYERLIKWEEARERKKHLSRARWHLPLSRRRFL